MFAIYFILFYLLLGIQRKKGKLFQNMICDQKLCGTIVTKFGLFVLETLACLKYKNVLTHPERSQSVWIFSWFKSKISQVRHVKFQTTFNMN